MMYLMYLWWYIKNWGDQILRLNSIMRSIWEQVTRRNLVISPHYVPSKENPADEPSRRRLHPLVTSRLHPEVYSRICAYFADRIAPKWDWMATKENAQLPLYVDPLKNLFGTNLIQVSPGWVNPPWHLIPHLLNYWASKPSQACALALLPYQPTAPWWGLFEQMREREYLVISGHKHLFLDLKGDPLEGRRQPLFAAILRGGIAPAKGGGAAISL